VSGVAGLLNPQNCILSDLTGYGPSNISANPGFLGGYLNQLFSSTVLDEGGNAITVRFTPVKPSGNYHINTGSPAIDLGAGPLAFAELAMDFDGQARPNPGGGIDSGADEFYLMANYVISGSVRTPVGLPIAGVTITLSGAANVATTTDAAGNYSFAGLTNGAYTVTPAFAGYTFSPTNRVVAISGANITGQNFTGTPTAGVYSISGRVKDSRGRSIPGITIRLAGIVNRTAITDTNGNYAFTGLAPGSYVVTPGMTGLAFSPVSRNITITNASFTGQDFEGRISAF
jgi:hypothetical protein